MLRFFKNSLAIILFAVTTLASADLFSDSTQQLTNLLQQFQSMQANFTQTSYNAEGVQTQQVSTGTMALQRPGKFRWQTTTPNKQLIIADGKFVWVYDADLEQATKQNIDGSQQANPASLLSGDVQLLQQRFDVSTLNQPGGQWFQLKPKTPNDLFQWIELNFQNNVLQQMRISDNLGQITEFAFSNVKINPSIPANLFTFNPPRGVDVVPE